MLGHHTSTHGQTWNLGKHAMDWIFNDLELITVYQIDGYSLSLSLCIDILEVYISTLKQTIMNMTYTLLIKICQCISKYLNDQFSAPNLAAQASSKSSTRYQAVLELEILKWRRHSRCVPAPSCDHCRPVGPFENRCADDTLPPNHDSGQWDICKLH